MKSWSWVGMIVLAGLVGGCEMDYIPGIDPTPKRGDLHTETSAPKTVELSVARAWYWNNEVTILGVAGPNSLMGDQKVAGFIDIEVLDKNNQVIDSNMATLMPALLSNDHPSQFKASFWVKTPGEDHLKVVFVDQRDEAAYLSGGDSDTGGKGAASNSGNYSRPSGGGSGAGSSTFGYGVSNTPGLTGLGSTTGFGHSAR